MIGPFGQSGNIQKAGLGLFWFLRACRGGNRADPGKIGGSGRLWPLTAGKKALGIGFRSGFGLGRHMTGFANEAALIPGNSVRDVLGHNPHFTQITHLRGLTARNNDGKDQAESAPEACLRLKL